VGFLKWKDVAELLAGAGAFLAGAAQMANTKGPDR